LKKLSQLDAIELARCPWARAMCLSELDGAEPARCSWASSQKLPNVLNCQVQSPLITLVLDMVPLKKRKVTYPWWNWASYMFWASSKRWKIVGYTIQLKHISQWEGWHPIYDGKKCSKPPTSDGWRGCFCLYEIWVGRVVVFLCDFRNVSIPHMLVLLWVSKLCVK